MRLYYEEDGITIYHGDCREVLPQLEVTELVFTSPPYSQQRLYESGFGDWSAIVPKMMHGLAPGPTQVLVNLGLVHEDGCVLEYWQSLFDSARAANWRLFGWYVWDKGFALPGDWNGRLAPAHEFIFHFNQSSRQPNKTMKCVSEGAMFHGKLRRPDGSMSEISRRAPVPEMKIPDSVVRLTPARGQDDYTDAHPAVFPIELPMHFLAAFTNPGETVLDPFMGSGTTLRAAKDLGRRAIGIEIEEKYCEIAAKRLAQKVLNF